MYAKPSWWVRFVRKFWDDQAYKDTHCEHGVRFPTFDCADCGQQRAPVVTTKLVDITDRLRSGGPSVLESPRVVVDEDPDPVGTFLTAVETIVDSVTDTASAVVDATSTDFGGFDGGDSGGGGGGSEF